MLKVLLSILSLFTPQIQLGGMRRFTSGGAFLGILDVSSLIQPGSAVSKRNLMKKRELQSEKLRQVSVGVRMTEATYHDRGQTG